MMVMVGGGGGHGPGDGGGFLVTPFLLLDLSHSCQFSSMLIILFYPPYPHI